MTLSRGRCSPYVVQTVTGPWTSPVNEGEECASMVRLREDVSKSGGRNGRLSLKVIFAKATSVWVLRPQPRVKKIGPGILRGSSWVHGIKDYMCMNMWPLHILRSNIYIIQPHSYP